MTMSPCHGARSHIRFVDENPGTQLPPEVKVTLSKGTVVGCIHLLEGMCNAFPHAEGGSPSIPSPGTTKAICDGPNTKLT